MRSSFIVVPFPLREKLHAMVDGNEAAVPVEFLLVRTVRPLHLAVLLGRADFRRAVRDAEVVEMPGERFPEFVSVVRLDLFHGKGQRFPDLVHEVGRALHGLMVVDPEDAVPGAVVNRGERVAPIARKRRFVEEFHIHLDAVARHGLRVPLRIPLPLLLVFEASHPMLAVERVFGSSGATRTSCISP